MVRAYLPNSEKEYSVFWLLVPCQGRPGCLYIYIYAFCSETAIRTRLLVSSLLCIIDHSDRTLSFQSNNVTLVVPSLNQGWYAVSWSRLWEVVSNSLVFLYSVGLLPIQGAWDQSKCDCCDEYTLQSPRRVLLERHCSSSLFACNASGGRTQAS